MLTTGTWKPAPRTIPRLWTDSAMAAMFLDMRPYLAPEGLDIDVRPQ